MLLLCVVGVGETCQSFLEEVLGGKGGAGTLTCIINKYKLDKLIEFTQDLLSKLICK
jgi:hypothetical protein